MFLFMWMGCCCALFSSVWCCWPCWALLAYYIHVCCECMNDVVESNSIIVVITFVQELLLYNSYDHSCTTAGNGKELWICILLEFGTMFLHLIKTFIPYCWIWICSIGVFHWFALPRIHLSFTGNVSDEREMFQDIVEGCVSRGWFSGMFTGHFQYLIIRL